MAGTRSDSENTPTVRARVRNAGLSAGSLMFCAAGTAVAWTSAGRSDTAAVRGSGSIGVATWKAEHSGARAQTRKKQCEEERAIKIYRTPSRGSTARRCDARVIAAGHL